MPNSQYILPERSQAWLESALKMKGYFHYFAVAFEGDIFPMGEWDAPFFTVEEAFQFKQELQKKYPERIFMRVEGAIFGSLSLKNKGVNKYWDVWIEKHLERVAILKGGDK